ncbi:pilus assembly PilX family protein [Alkalimarinus alittae]|uniref:PilX N-terminal domain-containing pilus assembly protein n=1 Tax=Alkalimarinus alittae TaxID=2961619 RepID=A0ABY6N0H5_9ALTE|nr:PilX N-terminal domain-containing pilus assembly protein [Alkalimarinus alittae]UZE95601.1 PilX N-terminal domain-containing pilus assembly protein [Alkalimarinus alittae]
MIFNTQLKPMQQTQTGAVLIVALVMLLLVTIIGTSAINMSTLGTKMTSNSRDNQVAFQAAESGLFAAEALLSPDVDIPVVGTTDGYMSATLSSGWWESAATAWWSSNGEAISSYNGQTTPRFVIEQPDIKSADSASSVQDLSVGVPKPAMFYYTSTSKGEGPGGATVHLQSVYARKVYLNTP